MHYIYSWLSITWTLANSNQNRFPLDFHRTFIVILPLVTRTSRKLEPIFVSLQVIFYILLPLITQTMLVKKRQEVKTNSTVVQNIEFILIEAGFALFGDALM